MRTYIILDLQESATSVLKTVLEDYPTISFLGAYNSYEDVFNAILKLKPDIVFYNLDLLPESPFKIVDELNSYVNILPNFIGISKNQKLAYGALKNNFFDYLISPLNELEIRKSILKLKKKVFLNSTKTICLKSYKDYKYINVDEILFLKADNNSTDFYISDGQIISAFKTLKIFENNLPNNFLRIHKSYIVNKNFISRINYSKLRCTVDKNLHKVPFTKTYIDNIELITNSFSAISIASQN